MPHEQLTLIEKTDDELRASIAKKREKDGIKAKLDPEEEELLLRQMHENQEEITNTYPH